MRLVTREEADAVDAAEAEGIFQQVIHRVIAGRTGAHVEVDFRILILDVDRRMQPARVHLQHRGHRFNRRRRPAGVAQH